MSSEEMGICAKNQKDTVGLYLLIWYINIYPAKDYPELFFNPDNLISLSNGEHNHMHDRLTDEITAKGRVWQKKVEGKLFGKNNI